MMKKELTADDIFELSRAFHNMATVVGQYRYDHWDEFTKSQRSDLENKQWTLFNTASDLNAETVLIKIKFIEKDLQVLKSATTAMLSTAKKIKNIKHAIRIAAKAVAFGGSIYAAASTGNVVIIISTALELIEEIGT